MTAATKSLVSPLSDAQKERDIGYNVKIINPLPTCELTSWFSPSECETIHRFAKRIVCGREWCPLCGQDSSIAHNRRFARWLPKVQQIKSMGYFVFTMPEELRSGYRLKTSRVVERDGEEVIVWTHPLAKLGHDIQELLKEFGYERGLRRWHPFGSKSTRYHPHLNCLVDSSVAGGFESPKKLEDIRNEYSRLLGVEVTDIKYRYRLSPGEKVHALKYVTKATFLDYNWDIELAMELKGFRNNVAWGRDKWNNPASWSLNDLDGKAKAEIEGLNIGAIEALVNKRCPVCDSQIIWREVLPAGLLDMLEKESFGAGYYRLADNKPPTAINEEAEMRLHWLELLHRVEVQEAIKRKEVKERVETEYQGMLWKDLLS